MENKEDVWEFEKLEQQLHSFFTEISELSKKKPNDGLNRFKLKFINSTLDALNRLIGEYRPFEDFDTFDVDEIPTNSDVVVILAQYAAAIHRFRSENTRKDNRDYQWYWLVKGKLSSIQTDQPENFRYEPK